MKKFGLNLNFDAIRKRIEADKNRYKPGVWADMVGVSVNVVSNIHGKSKRNPSLEYTIAVSMATGKSVDYYLWGKESKETPVVKPRSNLTKVVIEHQDVIKKFKDPKKAKEFNEFLIGVENHNPEGYDNLYGLAKTLYESTPEHHKESKKTKKKQQEQYTKRQANGK